MVKEIKAHLMQLSFISPERENCDKIISQPTESLKLGRKYDLATARFNDGMKSVRAAVISHLFQRISF